MAKEKIVILGAGHVGSHCANALASAGVGTEIVLVDIVPGKAHAQALDISDTISFLPHAATVRAGDYADCADAALVVVAIGEPRQPGQTRLDLLDRSVVLLDALVAQLAPYPIACPIVTITNPADVVADYLRKALQKERWQLFSTGTLLDTARLIRIISTATGVDRRSISAFALGEHGDSSTAAFSAITVGGIPFSQWHLDKAALTEQTRQAGMTIINGKGSTEFGIGQALTAMARCILNDEKRILPASVLLQGEYGQQDVTCGVPCRIGKNGIEAVIELPLAPDEQEALQASCNIIRKHIARAAAVHAQTARE